MSYTDPVKKAEAELAELERLAVESGEMQAQEPDEQDTGGTQTDAPAPDQQAAQTADIQVPDQQADDPDSDTWKQRFQTMRGKYDAEVPRLQAELNNLRAEFSRLEANAATADLSKFDNEDVDDPEYRSPYVSNEVRESRSYKKMVADFGQNYAETHCEAASLAARSEVKPVRQEAAETSRERYHGEISAKAPNWMVLNDDPAFISMMDRTVEPYSGRSLRSLLQEAYKSGDVSRTAKFFNDYEAGVNTASHTQTADNRQAADSQSAYIAPPRRGSAAQTTIDNNSGKIWTMSDVNTFYKDLELGVKYRGKEKEAAQIEAEIMKANAEGRII